MHREPATPTTKAPAERFTGDVWVDAVAAPPPPAQLTAGIVRFAPGARSAWHVHTLGQTLRILDGVAIIQNQNGDTIIAGPGETVHTPAGEWHWHGATTDRFMTHLALSDAPTDDQIAVTWGDHVTDDTYIAAHRGATATQETTYD